MDGARGERGSAAVQTVFAILFLLFLSLGVIEVLLALYARNVVASSAHEGARAAIELGRSELDAMRVAHRTVLDSAGGLVRDLRIDAAVTERTGVVTARVRLQGALVSVGPVPIPVPVDVVAVATGRSRDR